MHLKILLQAIAPQINVNVPDSEITTLTCDSRHVGPGTLFFALCGSKTDGHRYILQAVAAGAAAIVLENPAFAPQGVPWVQVANGRVAMAQIAARFNGSPTQGLPLIGITGTNGKTTTSYLIEAILQAAGIPAAVLGTISYRFGGTRIEASHTTPESTELQAIFRQLADAGAQAFVMEVSSHALEQHRVDGCDFNVGVFTNLTRDHLDYHGTMEAYGAAKQRLFHDLLQPGVPGELRCAVINIDDPAAVDFIKATDSTVIRYGVTADAEVTVRDACFSVNGITGRLVTPRGEQSFSSRLVGSYNLSNIMAAAAAGVALDLPLEIIVRGIEQQASVPGRLERVDNNCGVTCLVDYAHTGDALENVLSTLRQLATGRIITVFGCGGDRDNGKRPIMGRVAATYSDLAIVTSDNPRTEEPLSILAQIRNGILPLGLREYTAPELTGGCLKEKGFVMLENRREAIRLGANLAQSGDILLLAGKGHEDYQIIGTVKHHFDDREEATAAFRERS